METAKQRKSRSKSPKSRVPLAVPADEPTKKDDDLPKSITPEQFKQAVIYDIVDQEIRNTNPPQSESIEEVQKMAATIFSPKPNYTLPLPTGSSADAKSDEESKKFAKAANLYISFRSYYEGKITWNFKTDAQITKTKYEVILQELDIIRTLVNTQTSPDIIEGFIMILAESIEKITMVYPNKFAILHKLSPESVSFSESVKLNLDSGYFKPEIDQMAIEYQSWFNVGPELRTAKKLIGIAHAVTKDNEKLIASSNARTTRPSPDKFRL